MKTIIFRGILSSLLAGLCMLLADTYFSHKKKQEMIQDFESHPMAGIVQYFPRDHYLLTDDLWLDTGIAALASLFIFISASVMLRSSKR